MVAWETPMPTWARRRLSEHDIELSEQMCANGQDVLGCAAEADVVWVHSGSSCLDAEAVAALPRCRVILRTGAGTDNIPVDAATQAGIVVAHTPQAVMGPVAEHAIAMLLAVVRRIPHQHRLVREGQWDQFGQIGGPWWPLLERATLGLVGFGRIGRLVAAKLAGFEMKMLATDPQVDARTMRACGVEAVSMDELLERADFVSIHTPWTPRTHHLIGEPQLKRMKSDAILINTSRGPVVDEAALIRALQEGFIAAAALDVLEQEPPSENNPLRTMDNVVISPHNASFYKGYADDFIEHALATLFEISEGRMPPTYVNRDVKPRWNPVE